ncbi:hypothetical protein BD309DRAFT_963385 [Dichomitus squalens]|uniref:Uncharacterized protein n=1 Tax=Dichomitus squalens TaxID=114155 RepID=A0A4V2K3X7_9APHY|nr:hypothetical protein BD309DRAFT_963385 [Dichomitus squalens]TBU55773.1 hypothetical protein BD310DRAFT_932988 [Dichomitus squalens]
MHWWCNISSDILQNATLAAVTCSQEPNINSQCIALCPNADFTGVGVRTAFYVQSLMNTLLVVFSRRDSVPTTWAATLLTGALVIAAMVQKHNQSITLHHAILVLNFATLSCISSLAVAPTLSIWRLTPREYYAKRLARDMLDGHHDDAEEDRLIGEAAEVITGRRERKIARAQNRQRIVLALALLTQVVLQWAWGIVLFVSPVYSQTNCSGETALIFFLWRFTAREINDNMVVWVLWLLFSLGITLAMTVILALSSPVRARSGTQHASPASSLGATSLSTLSTPRPPVYRQVFESAAGMVPSWKDRSGQLIFWYNVVCVFLWSIYIISSEIQIQANCIFTGENSITSFGQITALLLSLAPVWSLTVAVYRWPQKQRRLQRRRRHAMLSSVQSQASNQSVVDIIVSNPDYDRGRPQRGSDIADGSKGHTTVEIMETATTALPTRERARPTGMLQSALRGGRERSRSQEPNAGAWPRSQGPGMRARTGHTNMPTGSLMSFPLPTNTEEEWTELATFPR